MIYMLITGAFLLLLVIMLLVPSVFNYKLTILLVTLSYVYALIGVFSFTYLHWAAAVLSLLALALVTAWITAGRLPEGEDAEQILKGTESEG
ncbi:hypothetical protein [Alkalicoccus saliphilus]|uniref:DUF2651 domain-containing protein n=1 Tax=Alkalicoccus saliphilus TaxID=200989 RepID=A0A2T4U5P0_9BACI|nr:hypothetical protein [Alkalicoccus saliphilus]PTL38675.1 hypothetical protein C6Y45_09985 [Alkalicoccus saliphilus]